MLDSIGRTDYRMVSRPTFLPRLCDLLLQSIPSPPVPYTALYVVVSKIKEFDWADAHDQ